MQPMTVSTVEQGPPDAMVGIEFGGPEGFKILSCAGLMYAPQAGDQVLVDYLGDIPFVVRCTTPGRTWVPSSLSLTILNTAPTDPDAVPFASIYGKPGALYAVRSSPVTAPTSTRLVVKPIGSGSFDPYGWRTDDTMPRQGSYGDGGCKGLWFYAADAFAPLAGLSGVTGRAKIRRADRGGNPAGPIQLQVGHHPHVTQPAGEPQVSNVVAPAGAKPGRSSRDITGRPVGGLVDFALDPLTVAAFVAGTAKGLAIASDVPELYLIALGPAHDADSGVLTFNWSS